MTSGSRREFIQGMAAGLVFHPSFAAALDIPAVKLAKAWIASYGDDLWGV